jgi:uncharacterized protein (DUF1501 family)
MNCSLHDHGPLRFKRTATRRDVLKFALGSAGIAALGPMLTRSLPTAYGAPLGNKILILINMEGGCDTLNSVIPNVPNYLLRRPTIGVPLASRLSLTGTSLYTLHPGLPNIRNLFNSAGADVALIQKVGYPTPNLSHFESQDIYAQGVRNGFGALGIPESGWVARYADNYAPTPMGAVSIGAGHPKTFVGGSSNPLQIGSVQGFKFGTDGGTFANNDAYRKVNIQQILAGATTVGTPGEVRAGIDQAFQLSGQMQTAFANYSSSVVYPNRPISNNLKDIARIIQGGFETRIFYTRQTSLANGNGFDTHSAEGATTGTHASLMSELDAAINAFALDMTAMNQWQNIVIAVYTEFGRRNGENASGGSDHGEAQSVILAGGAVSGGIFGPNIADADLLPDDLAYAVDFRDIWKEIVNDHLGSNPAPVFPEAQPINQTLGVV